jgi:hypothetical protein
MIDASPKKEKLMPIWAYHLTPIVLAIFIVILVETVAIGGLLLVRVLVVPRLRFHEGVNEAISGTVQAIGVFYGITVGLIAVGVWTTNSNSADLVSSEAAALGVLYRDCAGYPEPVGSAMQGKIREYIVTVIEQDWPAQKRGVPVPRGGSLVLDDLQSRLYSFEPANGSQSALHSETLRAYNHLVEARRRRFDAVDSSLSMTMWAVIWIGAAISVGVAYLYQIQDVKIHIILISLMAGFLGILLFMIVVNDRPFLGAVSLSTDPYQIVLDRVIDKK